ncbi:glutathione S-transferase family protein [Halomonas sp. M4R5S39]|uniref:glutathione S-transferase family protein n=1 Tax=Halomonas kalidii TaxID=3043293 RepID=UPI0024A86D79|nr:glutathione S-transferase family protein [Halomonas kalidii]MDI5987236.1 glutathione S-transferase family protein [Halomonas kalidii]
MTHPCTGQAPTYRLFYSPDSANLVIRMVLEELGAGYRAVRIDRARGGLDDPAFRTLNPQGLLPVLVDETGGVPLFETGAILLHLCERHASLAITDPAHRGPFLAWLFFLSNTLHADLRVRFYAWRYAEGKAEIQHLREMLSRRIQQHLQLLEELADHGQGAGLLPSGPSVLDPYLACLVRWMQLYPLDAPLGGIARDEYPHLVQLLRRLEGRPAIRRAAAAEGIEGRLFLTPDYPRGDPCRLVGHAPNQID